MQSKATRAILSIDDFNIDRFLTNVRELGADDCWPWIGRQGSVYPDFAIKIKTGKWVTVLGHRVMFYLANGYLPDIKQRKEVLHVCNNVICLNPNHLACGTHKQNLNDPHRTRLISLAKRGTGNKLSQQEVITIFKSKETMTSLSAKYHISYKTIQLIKAKRRWGWLTAELGEAPKVPRFGRYD